MLHTMKGGDDVIALLRLLSLRLRQIYIYTYSFQSIIAMIYPDSIFILSMLRFETVVKETIPSSGRSGYKSRCTAGGQQRQEEKKERKKERKKKIPRQRSLLLFFFFF